MIMKGKDLKGRSPGTFCHHLLVTHSITLVFYVKAELPGNRPMAAVLF
jgi:hypothetical protein